MAPGLWFHLTARCLTTHSLCIMILQTRDNMQVKCRHFWSRWQAGPFPCHLQAITVARSGSPRPLETILHLTRPASPEPTFQVFGKHFLTVLHKADIFSSMIGKMSRRLLFKSLSPWLAPVLSSSLSSQAPILSHVTNNNISGVVFLPLVRCKLPQPSCPAFKLLATQLVLLPLNGPELALVH